MDEEKPIDANLLRRMMMGDFSSDSSGFTSSKKLAKSSSPKRKVELDLHFEKLYPSKGNLGSGEKLKLQIDELNHFVKDGRKQGVTSAYVIVGKGDGVLRKEVKKILTQKQIRFSEITNPPYFGNALKVYL
ncbi:Smr/MutS family protein [Bacteroidia bacterium]|nr:Smr/MutS family protein [Bacteroidia bacterium]MDB9883082.1 Smr/MutS family protein [Bacteroidia bacterium]